MLGLLRASSQGATTRGVKYWTLCPGRSYRLVAEVVAVSEAGRLAALERAGLVHPRAEAVTAPLFSSGGFFLAADKVQVTASARGCTSPALSSAASRPASLTATTSATRR